MTEREAEIGRLLGVAERLLADEAMAKGLRLTGLEKFKRFLVCINSSARARGNSPQLRKSLEQLHKLG
jgi:hypothetical protein